MAFGIIFISYYAFRSRGILMAQKYTHDDMMNLNYVAERIAAYEGKKEQVNIAQIKECLKYTLQVFANEFTIIDIENVLLKYKK